MAHLVEDACPSVGWWEAKGGAQLREGERREGVGLHELLERLESRVAGEVALLKGVEEGEQRVRLDWDHTLPRCIG